MKPDLCTGPHFTEAAAARGLPVDWRLAAHRCEALPTGHRRPLLEIAAKSAAVGDEYAPDDADLAQVIVAWHSPLPDTRTAILAIVEAVQGR